MTEQTLVTESGDKIHLPCYMTGFLLDIERMNGMYRMPEVVDYIDPMLLRLKEFRSILGEEVQEIDDIDWDTTSTTKAAMDVRIQFADLLGDIIVYCASEAKRWNIPIDRVLNIIMQSNFSKLDANGQPIYDERMKLQKGPNYWKPEPKIAQLLLEYKHA
jgi:predicted HAD superfamily Cof-like phosphohydrolase